VGPVRFADATLACVAADEEKTALPSSVVTLSAVPLTKIESLSSSSAPVTATLGPLFEETVTVPETGTGAASAPNTGVASKSSATAAVANNPSWRRETSMLRIAWAIH
jgi:hypothetical protein